MRNKIMRRTRCFITIIVTLLVYMITASVLEIQIHSKEKFEFNVFEVGKYIVQSSFLKEDLILLSNGVEERIKQILDDGLEDSSLIAYMIDMKNKMENNIIEISEVKPKPEVGRFLYSNNFDPRYALGLLLHELGRQLSKDVSKDDLKLPYFNWADWVDVSALEKHILADKKPLCKEYFDQSGSNKKSNAKKEVYRADLYCFNDVDIDRMLDTSEEESMQNQLLSALKTNPDSTGWHIFRYGGRTKTELRLLSAKSYLYDFSPPPQMVVLLLPDEGQKFGVRSFEIEVNQNITVGKRRLRDTPLLADYISELKNEPDPSDPKATPTLDIEKAMTNLLQEALKFPEADTGPDLPYNKELKPEMFEDKSNKILESLKSLESLNYNDKAYRDSLEYSLSVSEPIKHFFEAKLLPSEKSAGYGDHYDWRFYNGVINNSDSMKHSLYGLIRAWLSFTNKHHFNTWIAHGTLLAWYWEGTMFPWDEDFDVQISVEDLHNMLQQFNQSIIVDFGGQDGNEIRYGRYFLDITSFISHRKKQNGNNNIDARFIDIDSGLYVDITGLALSDTKAPDRYNNLLSEDLERGKKGKEVSEMQRNEFLQAYNCRNEHFSTLNELNPLTLTFFEGRPAYIPHDFEAGLIAEYKHESLLSATHKKYVFIPQLNNWIQTDTLKSYTSKDPEKTISLMGLPDSNCLSLLRDNDQLLAEYYMTRSISSFHKAEMQCLTEKVSAKSLIYSEEGLDIHFKDLRHDYYLFREELKHLF